MNTDEKFLIDFSNLFLKVTKSLQKVKIWNESQNDNSRKGEWKTLFEESLKELYVLYGYFVEYDPNENEVRYFIEGKQNYQKADFIPPFLPYFNSKNEKVPIPKPLLDELVKLESKFVTLIKSPKIFQHLPVQPKEKESFEDFTLISDICLNCRVPCEIRKKNDFYVVFFDEIAFFQFAYLKLNEIDVFELYKGRENEYLLYVLKFAVGVERKFGKSDLWQKLNLDGNTLFDSTFWNHKDKDENIVRKTIEHQVEENFNQIWVGEVKELLYGIIEELLLEARGLKSFENIDKLSELEILKSISRFDIMSSLEIKDENQLLLFHDYFVFPIYTQKSEKVFTTSCINGQELDIHSPVLLVLYIKTRKFIDGLNDEDKESIDGFHLTKEITKLFSEKIVQEDYLKKNIRKEIRYQATLSAIAQVMARNTSHNIGAHVMNNLIGDIKKVDVNKFRNYINHRDENSRLNTDLYEQISNFNSYLKYRMDYLADISFGSPLMQTNKYAYKDLFSELDKVRILLEYISGLRSWSFEIQFKLNGEILTKNNDILVAIPNDILGSQAFYNILENVIRNSAKHSDKSELTSNVIFTINFINDVEKVTDYCEVENCNSNDCMKAHKSEIINVLRDFIAVEIYDNIPVVGHGRLLTSKEKEEFEVKTNRKLLKFNRRIDELIFNQNRKLNEDILDENSKLRSYSLGLVEMDASAAYLRKHPIEYINHRSYEIQYDESWSRDTEKNREKNQDPVKLRGTNCRHFLKAFEKKENAKSYLGYRFFLHKPAVVLVVSSILDNNRKRYEELKNEGVLFVSPQLFENDLSLGKVFPHEFVLVDSSNDGNGSNLTELIQKNKTALPIRVISAPSDTLIELLSVGVEGDTLTSLNIKYTGSIIEVWEEFCWKQWDLNNLYLDIPEKLCLPRRGNLYAVLNDHEFNNGFDKDYKKKIAYYEDALTTLGQERLPGFNGSILMYQSEVLLWDATLKRKIGESVYSSILVIDERIQNHSEREFNEKFKFHDLYAMTGIKVPRIDEINLSAKTMDETLSNKILEEVENFKDERLNINRGNTEDHNFLINYDFIIFHYSVLERIFKNDKIKINKYLNILSISENIVVTSGRGEPDGLPKEVRFINLSSVIFGMIEVRSKYFLNYILHQSRKSNKFKS